MRTTLSALALLLGCAAIVPAQGPAARDTDNQKQLDYHLREWETKMRGVTALNATITRIDKDAVFKNSIKYSGYALYMKAGKPGAVPLNLARLQLWKDDPGKPSNPTARKESDVSEKIISTGTYLYQWVPGRKEIWQHEVPKPKAGVPMEDNFLGLVFGMKAEQAKKRYDLRLYKVDAHYVYVDIAPKYPDDKAEFSAARLVLHRSSYLPRQLWFRHPNKNEILWDIPSSHINRPIDRRWFDSPRAEPGWKIVPAPKATGGGAAPSRVIRGERR